MDSQWKEISSTISRVRRSYHVGSIPSMHAEMLCHVPHQKLFNVKYVHDNLSSAANYKEISALTLGMFCQQMFQILEGMGEVLQLMLQVDVFFLQIVDGVLKLIT